MLLVLFVITTATFLLMHAIPGGPFTAEKNLRSGAEESHERYHSTTSLEAVRRLSRQRRPRDLGRRSSTRPALSTISSPKLPVSAELGLTAVLIAVAGGIRWGWPPRCARTLPDYLCMFVATIGISVPGFILATLFIYFFALQLELFPAAMWEGPEYVVLPALSLAAFPMAFIARLTRSSMLEVLGQDFIRTARAKGLSAFAVVMRHALKNALIPVVTYLGPLVAAILTGSFVIESIFAIPGLGRHFVTSIYNRDYTVILGITIFYSTLLVFLNFLVDVAYAWLDPRIKLDGGKGE
jgi:oligopeptide transport system permease protein